MMRLRIKFEYWAAVAVCLCAGLLLLRFFALPVLFACLPFLFAAGLVILLDPAAKAISKRLHWKRSVCALLLFFGCMVATLLLGGIALASLLREGQALLAKWMTDLSSPSSLISNAVDALRLPENAEGEAFRLQLKTMLTDLSSRILGELAANLPVLAGKAASNIPSVILFLVVTVTAGVKFCVSGGGIWQNLLALLPLKRQRAIEDKRAKAVVFFRQYLRAYLLLFLLMSFLLLIGFWALGVKYALVAAFLVALVDLLPVLGTATVLIPWAILELLCGQYRLGFGLLILCLAAMVVRQIVEPHLVGKSLGVSPLLSLAAGYAGWRIAGVAGLVLGPLLLPILKWGIENFMPKNRKKNE